MGQHFSRIWVALEYVSGAALIVGGGALIAVDILGVQALLGAVLMLFGAGVLDRLGREPTARGR